MSESSDKYNEEWYKAERVAHAGNPARSMAARERSHGNEKDAKWWDDRVAEVDELKESVMVDMENLTRDMSIGELAKFYADTQTLADSNGSKRLKIESKVLYEILGDRRRAQREIDLRNKQNGKQN